MSESEPSGFAPDRIDIGVILEQGEIARGGWTFPRWRVAGVVASAHNGECEIRAQPLRRDGGQTQTLWRGFPLELHRDSAEAYWYNLVGKQPSLFVICRPREDAALAPFRVTADYDEAGAHMEADDAVFSVAMPPEVYRWLEAYVMDNYRPRQPKKRRREDWTQRGRDGG